MAHKTKEDFMKEKTRMGTAKAASTRANYSLRRMCKELEALIERRENDPTDWKEATAKKTAEAIQKCRGTSEAALDNIEIVGHTLKEVILGMKPDENPEGLEVLTNKVSEDIDEYNNKYGELKLTFISTLGEADELTAAEKPAQLSRSRETSETPEFAQF